MVNSAIKAGKITVRRKQIKEVGAITVIQPWAHIILHKGKNVENRQRTSHYRGTIAIHASATKSKAWFDECAFKVNPGNLAYGAVVGFADLIDVITKETINSKTKKWFEGKYGLVLANVVVLKKPVKVCGQRGVWRLKGKALKECTAQLSIARLKRFKEFKRID